MNPNTFSYLGKDGSFSLENTLKAIQGSQPKDTILLHPCAHNPTGMDPTYEEWKEIARALKQCNVVPFFDFSFQGLASGSLEKDRQAIEIFEQQGLQMIIAQSYSKIMGLYGNSRPNF